MIGDAEMVGGAFWIPAFAGMTGAENGRVRSESVVFRRSRACARLALTLALSHQGLAGVCLWLARLRLAAQAPST